jgi:hypothetical protein
LCQLLVDRRKCLAVSTPRSEKLNKSRLARNCDLVEIVWDEIEDCGVVESWWGASRPFGNR